MSNAADGNSVLVFDRDLVGKLTPAGEFDTGGLGTGAVLQALHAGLCTGA